MHTIKFQFVEQNSVECWCDFGANLVQHFMRRYSRYSRYRTKSHNKCTISHDITRYSRYQTALLKLEEITKRDTHVSFVWHPSFIGGCLSLLSRLVPRLTRAQPLSVGLKTVHRTVFLTPSQFTRDNHKSTPLECFLLSPEACPRISSERSEDFIQEMLGFHHYRWFHFLSAVLFTFGKNYGTIQLLDK